MSRNYVANDPTGSRIPIPGPGREAIWKDPAAMYAAGLEYFQRKAAAKERFTVSGLALDLGLSWWTLNDYAKKPAFSSVVKELKSFILEQGEIALFDRDTANGAKFHLNVLGMRETQVIESVNTNVNTEVTAASLKDLSDEDLNRLAEISAKLTNGGADRGGNPSAEAEQDQNPVSGLGGVSP